MKIGVWDIMYNDYDVIYKSNLNEYLVIWIAFSVIAFLLLLLTFFALSKIFKKANHSGIAAWIPIYNAYLLTEIANMPVVYFIFMFIPVLNIYSLYKINQSLAGLFKKSKLFGYGLLLFPFIYYPILAFSDSEYIGINLFGLQGTTTVEDIPIIDENKNQEIEVNVNDSIDLATPSANISLGGGKYQKDYASNLVDVDRSQVLNKVEAEKAAKLNPIPRENKFISNNIPNNVVAPQPAMPNKNDMFSVPFIDANPSGDPMVQQPIINNQPDVVIPGPVIPTENVSNSTSNSSLSSVDQSTGFSVCPNCGTRVSDGAKVCFICGQPL